MYGKLTAPTAVRAINAFVVPLRGRLYAWAISFLAGLWVLSRLIRHWTMDRLTLAFRPTEEPLTARGLFWSNQEGSADA
jgi:hypothetical protein